MDNDFYPEKPELIENKPNSSLALTIFSILLFVLVFLLIFREEVENILYLVVILLIHELGHFSMMKLFKYENVRMLFVPLMGAFVQGKKMNYSQKQSFLVILAGPLPGMLIGSGLIWYGTASHSEWMIRVGILFIGLNVINLLPLDPLDGGQLFKLFVRRKNELFLMVFALISSLAVILVGVLIQQYIIVMLGFFMGFRVRALQKQYQVHKELMEEEVDYAVNYSKLSNREFSIIKRIVLNNTPALQKYIDEVSEDDADPILASQVNNVLRAPIDSDAGVLLKGVIVLSWIASLALPFILFYTIDWTWFASVVNF